MCDQHLSQRGGLSKWARLGKHGKGKIAQDRVDAGTGSAVNQRAILDIKTSKKKIKPEPCGLRKSRVGDNS